MRSIIIVIIVDKSIGQRHKIRHNCFIQGMEHQSKCGGTLVDKIILFFCNFSIIIFIEVKIYMSNTLQLPIVFVFIFTNFISFFFLLFISSSKYFSNSLVGCLWACKIFCRISIQEDMFRKTFLDNIGIQLITQFHFFQFL